MARTKTSGNSKSSPPKGAGRGGPAKGAGLGGPAKGASMLPMQPPLTAEVLARNSAVQDNHDPVEQEYRRLRMWEKRDDAARSMQVIRDIRDNQDELAPTRLMAADKILDRVLGKPIATNINENTSVPPEEAARRADVRARLYATLSAMALPSPLDDE